MNAYRGLGPCRMNMTPAAAHGCSCPGPRHGNFLQAPQRASLPALLILREEIMLLSLPGERPALVLSSQESRWAGGCRITHGPNDSYFENIVGKSVASIRRCLATAFSIPTEADAFIGGSAVAGLPRLRAGDSLEFLVGRG